MAVLVVNAISVREGGSLVVLDRLVSRMAAARPDWEWHVVTHDSVRLEAASPRISFHRFPRENASAWRTRLWYEIGLPALTKRVGADVLFSMTNYLPRRRMPCRTALLLQHAGHFSEAFRTLTERSLGAAGRVAWRLKGQWVRGSLRRADVATVQTKALARLVVEQLHLPATRISVIAHGPGQCTPGSAVVGSVTANVALRVGYVTKFGVQKNFAVVFDAIARLNASGVLATLVLTLDPAAGETRKLLSQAQSAGISSSIENHGEVGPSELHEIYGSLHAFVFASLCESFGFPMLEAMCHGLPLLVADTESNAEVAGAGAVRFRADDSAGLAKELAKLARDPQWHRLRAEASLARAHQFDWDAAASNTVLMLDRLIAGDGTAALATP